MNQYNDKGNKHGYWDMGDYVINFYNGILHGEYISYWYKDKKYIYTKGYYYMGEHHGYWEYIRRNETLYRKSFYL